MKTIIAVALVLVMAASAQAAAVVITTGAPTSTGTMQQADKCVDGSGLSAALTTDPSSLTGVTHHSAGNWADSTHLLSGASAIFDLGALYNLSQVAVWGNSGQTSGYGYNVYHSYDVDISSSVDGVTWSAVVNKALNPTDAYEVPLDLLTYSAAGVRYVSLTPKNASSGWNELGEVRFVGSAVPEPATMSLLVLGGVATLIRRRNRR